MYVVIYVSGVCINVYVLRKSMGTYVQVCTCVFVGEFMCISVYVHVCTCLCVYVLCVRWESVTYVPRVCVRV